MDHLQSLALDAASWVAQNPTLTTSLGAGAVGWAGFLRRPLWRLVVTAFLFLTWPARAGLRAWRGKPGELCQALLDALAGGVAREAVHAGHAPGEVPEGGAKAAPAPAVLATTAAGTMVTVWVENCTLHVVAHDGTSVADVLTPREAGRVEAAFRAALARLDEADRQAREAAQRADRAVRGARALAAMRGVAKPATPNVLSNNAAPMCDRGKCCTCGCQSGKTCRCAPARKGA